MTWCADIRLRNSNNVLVEKLTSIKIFDEQGDFLVSDIKDFNDFHLGANTWLTFLSDATVLALSSADILYIQFSSTN